MWWRAVRDPLAARMFSRAFGSAAATSTIVSPSASSPRSKINAARRALSMVDSAADEAGSTARSTTPLCDSSHCPSVNGADADASMGMPTLADRTAATTHPLRRTGATDANDASPHSGAALRHRRATPSSSKNPTPQPSAFIRPCFCRRGEYDCTRRPYGGSSISDATDTRLTEPAEVPTHQASQASRRPLKICLRIGWSQFRKLGRRMSAATAHDPPRSTL